MRQVRATAIGFERRTIARVLPLGGLGREFDPNLQHLVRVQSSEELDVLQRLLCAGLENLTPVFSGRGASGRGLGRCLDDPDGLLSNGDVVAITPRSGLVEVLIRESDQHHTVFLTNRCNSRCLMCSQPPTLHDDHWIADEAIAVGLHMGRSPEVLGFTGGEPLLLGGQLRRVLDSYLERHPSTRFEVLTNGRLLADERLAEQILVDLPPRVSWMVPLYGHATFLHDYVVQAKGAFDETVGGLLRLQEHRQPVQLRIVLIRPVLEWLEDLCSFITSNFPFVREVALMGCEPTGYALANRDQCAVDLADWGDTLLRAVKILHRGDLRPILMNIPLCALPRVLRGHAHKSISDWKRVYLPECKDCAVRDECAGLFAWHERGWRPSRIRPILLEGA